MNLNFEYYKVFYYVCKCGSLTGAANVLMTSQPGSDPHHPQSGKRHWLPSLYPAAKNGVELTPEGGPSTNIFSAACAQIFKGENELAGMISLDNGTVCISATETALHCCLFKAMEEFNRYYPNVQFKLLNNSTVNSIQALKSGRVDMAVVSSMPLQRESHLQIKSLRKYHDILIGGNKFQHLKGKKTSLEELKDYPWIGLTSGSITRTSLDRYFNELGLPFNPDIELATTDMILPVVRHNLGIGFIPSEFAAEDIRRGTVFEINIEERLPERDILLVYDTEYPQSIAAKTFQKYLISAEYPD